MWALTCIYRYFEANLLIQTFFTFKSTSIEYIKEFSSLYIMGHAIAFARGSNDIEHIRNRVEEYADLFISFSNNNEWQLKMMCKAMNIECTRILFLNECFEIIKPTLHITSPIVILPSQTFHTQYIIENYASMAILSDWAIVFVTKSIAKKHSIKYPHLFT